MVKAVLAE